MEPGGISSRCMKCRRFCGRFLDTKSLDASALFAFELALGPMVRAQALEAAQWILKATSWSMCTKTNKVVHATVENAVFQVNSCSCLCVRDKTRFNLTAEVQGWHLQQVQPHRARPDEQSLPRNHTQCQPWAASRHITRWPMQPHSPKCSWQSMARLGPSSSGARAVVSAMAALEGVPGVGGAQL